jgi:hypothetical protein
VGEEYACVLCNLPDFLFCSFLDHSVTHPLQRRRSAADDALSATDL